MGKTVGELVRTMSFAEFAEWQAYDQLDPIGGYRTDLGFALLAYLQAGDKDKSVQDFLIIDPNPMTDEERQQHELEHAQTQARAEVAAMLAMFNAR